MSGPICQSTVLAVALLLAGCSSPREPGPEKDTRPPEQRPTYDEYYIPGSGSIFDFRLTDGTRCVAHRWDGGITCDWRAAP
jgi:hypothetical protein